MPCTMHHIMFACFLSALCSGKAVDGTKLARLLFSKFSLARSLW